MNTLFLALFTPLCCFIVSLTIPAASLQGLVFWKWNASYPEASLDGVHYWFGDDDCCSSCPWLPAPLRAFLLQVNNRQQKARRNSRTGSVTRLCMPGTLNIMHIRAAPIPSFSPGHCDILFDIYILPLTMAQDTFSRECMNFAVLIDMWYWLTRRGTTFLAKEITIRVPKIEIVLGPLGPPRSFYNLKHQGQPLASWMSTSRLKISLLNWSSPCTCCKKVTAEFVDSPWEISLARSCSWPRMPCNVHLLGWQGGTACGQRAAHSWLVNASSLTFHSSSWSMELENEE